MFNAANSFNQNIGGWITTSCTNMSAMFAGATVFNQDISSWDVSNVTNLSRMFNSANSFNQNIGSWVTSSCTNMNAMFANSSSFNQNINGWNTTNVTDMSSMFNGASVFNQDLNNWTTTNVNTMFDMFSNASSFNGDITTWDTQNVTTMRQMFSYATAFNQNIGGWNVSSVTNMVIMFRQCVNFNQNIGNWDTRSVTDMALMFDNATSFNQNLGAWDLRSIVPGTAFYDMMEAMLIFTAMDCENYSNTLIGWSANPATPNNVGFGGGSSKYNSSAIAARNNLVNNKGWTISDGGLTGAVTFSFGNSITQCAGGSVPTLPTSSTQSVTGVWSPTNIDNSTSGTYIFTPDPGQCTSGNYTLNVTISGGPTASAGLDKIINCTNTSVVLDGSGGGSYSWSNGAGNVQSPTVSPSITTTYTLTVTSSGCTSTDQVTVTVDNAIPTASAGTNQTIACGSSTVNLNGSGGTSYSWSPSGSLTGATSATPTSNAITNTTYTLTVTGANGCTDTDQVDVIVNQSPTTSLAGTNNSQCQTVGSYTLSGNTPTIGTGLWTQISGSSSTITSPNSPTSSVTGLTSPGSYTYQWEINNAPCSPSSSQVTITVLPTEDASFTYANATYCLTGTNPSPLITGTIGGTFTINNSGIINASTGQINLTSSGVGNYQVTYTTGGACSSSSTQNITVNTVPTSPLITTSSPNNEICLGDSITINASGSGSNIIYNVFDALTGGNLLGSTPITVDPTTNISYYIDAENSNGCTSVGGRTIVTVQVNGLPTIEAGEDEIICIGDSITLTAFGTGDFSWSTGEITADILVSPISPTYYLVTLTDGNSCVNKDSVLVDITNLGNSFSAVNDFYTVEEAEVTSLEVLSNDTYFGNSLAIINPSNNGSTTVEFDQTITYQSNENFEGIDSFVYTICSNDCPNICDTAQVEITIEKSIELAVSGGFSPNGDNINDLFIINGLGKYPDNTLSVFNRWGSLVYQSSPYNNDWGGKSNENGILFGKELPTGTYFYILELNEEIDPFKGSIEIKR